MTWEDYRSGNADIYAQRVNAAGVPQWTANGVALCTAANDQLAPTIVSDGTGGAIVAWYDVRSGNADIYAQRVNAAGVPQWTANGVALCTAANNQYYPTIVSDGAGGAIVTWQDVRGGTTYDIYAQRVNAAGIPQWTGNGVALCTAGNDQLIPMSVSDGAGGAIVTWEDYRGVSAPDIYAQRVNAAGVPQWTANGVALCTAIDNQDNPTIASDGAGGAIVTWYDYRSGLSTDIYAQRVNAAGVPQWNTNGVALCTAANNQYYPTIASDGAGGAVVTWQDYRSGIDNDIYAQWVNGAGAPQWTIDGVALCTAVGDQVNPTIASDGAGGAIVTWEDLRSGITYDIYAQRVSAAGFTQWTYNGMALCTAVNGQYDPTIVSDGVGGAIVTWQDLRSDIDYDIYAQRIERFGRLGNPEPVSAGIRDVPNDQGGKVKVSWYASYLDADPNYEIGNYTVWRSAPPNLALSAVRAGALLLRPGEPLPAGSGRVFTSSVERAQTTFWELVGTQVAVGDSGYSFVTPTTSDSVAAGNPKTMFRIQARDVNGYAFWNSAPDSGYSVDNLPPVAPAPFAGAYSAGVTHLHWGENSEPDLAGYRLYRGNSAGFVPGPGNLVVAKPDTGYSDAGPAGSYYKLSAVDIHGNESGFALLTPAGIAGVGPVEAPTLALAGAWPNPATGGRLNIAFELPAAGPARLELVDVNGRSAASREVGGLGTGRHTVDMAAGRAVPPGLYLVRLSRGGDVRTARVVVLK